MVVFDCNVPCFNPLRAFKGVCIEPGKVNIVWKEKDSAEGESIVLPCGRCDGCKMERARQWTVRCVHESKMWDSNCFVTLTYNDANLPQGGTLVKKDFQDFMKRLRRKYGSGIRFFQCGEYGGDRGRPHYHAILFNHDFADKVPFSKRGDSILYTSEDLDALWGKGFASVGSVTPESIAYVCRYVLKKVSGKDADMHYLNPVSGMLLEPEYVNMSRGGSRKGPGGIGQSWYREFKGDVFPSDEVIVSGRSCKPPRFYDKLLEKDDPGLLKDVKELRLEMAPKGYEASAERLAVKESCFKARMALYKRPLED